MAGKQLLSLAAFMLACAAAQTCQSQHTFRPYDGIQAGYDAFQLAEEKRQITAGQQLDLNQRMRTWNTPLATYGFGYGAYYNTYGVAPASRDYAYAHGHTAYAAGYASRPLTVFEPWPYIPGDIWGDFYIPPLCQPVGQVQSQTGPNRWESHPVYDPPLIRNPVLPPVNSRALDNTPYATEHVEVPLAPAAEAYSYPPTIERSAVPEPPSPGPSPDDEPVRPERREF